MGSYSSPPATQTTEDDCGESRQAVRQSLAATAAVFLSFLSYSVVRAPVPGVNEPHYLTKARHFWNPEWCRGDLFLESADVHVVYFETVGAITQWLTFEQTAWVGRIVALGLLAIGWAALVRRLVPGRWASLPAAWGFLLLSAIGNLSGEWMVGGVEAKVFAYAFVFLALAFCCDRSWNWAAVAFGLGVSFHPVVGGWSLLCALFAGSAMSMRRRSHASPASRERPAPPENRQVAEQPGNQSAASGVRVPQQPVRPRAGTAPTRFLVRGLKRAALAVGLLIAAALPGLIPALRLLETTSAKLSFDADYIQVFYRLSHHLNPAEFPAVAYFCYAVLVLLWLIARRRAGLTDGEKFFAWFVVGTLIVAAVGLAVGIGAKPPRIIDPEARFVFGLRMKLLKLYPFRLFDVIMPVAVSIVVAGCARRWFLGDGSVARPDSQANRRRIAWVLVGGIMLLTLLLPSADRNASRMTPADRAEWRDVCRWIAAETIERSLFLTPTRNLTFKWYAQRPEYVSYKDCPQDADGIVEWNRRLLFLQEWARSRFDGGYSAEAVRELQRETGITHILARRRGKGRLGPFAAELVYRNRTFAVFRVAHPAR